jgi:hypothetical protein
VNILKDIERTKVKANKGKDIVKTCKVNAMYGIGFLEHLKLVGHSACKHTRV